MEEKEQIAGILHRLSEGDKEFALLKKDIKSLEKGVDACNKGIDNIINRMSEGIEPLVSWNNGTKERIPISEAMERTILKVVSIDERTEVLDDLLKLKKAIQQIKNSFYKYFFKTFYWCFTALWKIGFVIFIIMLVLSLFKGDLTFSDLLKQLF
jgi:uncharacterized phage infection (PIP) family protein YhgE